MASNQNRHTGSLPLAFEKDNRSALDSVLCNYHWMFEREACMATTARWITAAVAVVAFASLAVAQSDLNPKNRQELKREDVAGTNMEVIISVVERSLASYWPVTFIMVRRRSMCFKEQRSKHQMGSKSNFRRGLPPSTIATFLMSG